MKESPEKEMQEIHARKKFPGRTGFLQKESIRLPATYCRKEVS